MKRGNQVSKLADIIFEELQTDYTDDYEKAIAIETRMKEYLIEMVSLLITRKLREGK